jgi:hypothetical protein
MQRNKIAAQFILFEFTPFGVISRLREYLLHVGNLSGLRMVSRFPRHPAQSTRALSGAAGWLGDGFFRSPGSSASHPRHADVPGRQHRLLVIKKTVKGEAAPKPPPSTTAWRGRFSRRNSRSQSLCRTIQGAFASHLRWSNPKRFLTSSCCVLIVSFWLVMLQIGWFVSGLPSTLCWAMIVLTVYVSVILAHGITNRQASTNSLLRPILSN